MRHFRSTLALGIAVALLIGYLLLVDRHQLGTEERERRETSPFTIDAGQIDRLQIGVGQDAVVLARRDGGWRLVRPIETAADPAVIAGLLQELQRLEARRVIPFADIPQPAQTLPQWGLSPGNRRIEFSGKGFDDLLVIGRKTAVSDLIYARAVRGPGEREAEAPVCLVPGATGAAFDVKLADLRSRAVLSADPAQVERFGIRVDTADAPVEYEIVRVGADWKLQKPLAARADAKRTAAWLDRLAKLKVKQFVADDAASLSAYGLSSPVSQIWIAPRGGKGPETLLVGLPVPGTPGEVYARRPDKAVVTLDAAAVDKLLRELPDVRDRHLLPFAPGEATGLRIEWPRAEGQAAAPAAATALDRTDGKWVVGAAQGQADAQKVGAFLDALAALEAAEVVSDTAADLRPYGLDRPDGRITVLRKEKGEPLVLSLGRAEKGRLYAKNSLASTVYLVDPVFLNQAPRDAWGWQGPEVTDLKPEQIVSVSLALDGAPPFTLTRQEAAYTADRAGAAPDPAKAAALWEAVGHLRAARWLGPAQPAYGLEKPYLRLHAAGEKPFTLLVGAPQPSGGRAAQVEGQPNVFLLSNTDLAVLAASPFAAPAAAPAKTAP